MSGPRVITEPRPGDPDRGEDVLNDVQAVMKKHGTALVLQDGNLFLCVRQPNGPPRAIAAVSIITPEGFSFKPFDWTKGKPQ
jgi:hypothetical protein